MGPGSSVYERIFEFTPDALLVVGASGTILLVNAQAVALFGYPSRDALIGRPVEDLIPARFAASHAGLRGGYVASPRLRPMGATRELFARRADGSEVAVDIMLGPVEAEDGPGVLCVVRDVTERHKAERRLRESLAEKDVLLREIHHRVKNNLAVISSLLYLHGARVADPALTAAFEDSRDRIRAMSLVHETLYRSGTLASVDVGAFARTLCGELVRGHRTPACAVSVEVVAGPVALGVDVAVPCALVLNELVTNALKHAFRGRAAGAIVVRIASAPALAISVEDDGVGMAPPGAEAGSLGLELVHLLARQIDAVFTVASSDAGTRATLALPGGEAPA